jgi:hypothetical protein
MVAPPYRDWVIICLWRKESREGQRDGKADAGLKLLLGLKALAGDLPSLPGLPVYKSSLPNVETVGYLLPSREVELDCRGFKSD